MVVPSSRGNANSSGTARPKLSAQSKSFSKGLESTLAIHAANGSEMRRRNRAFSLGQVLLVLRVPVN